MSSNTLLSIALGILSLGGNIVIADGPQANSMEGADRESVRSVIVQGQEFEVVRRSVQSLGARLTHELPLINAVAVRLTPEQELVLAGRFRVLDDQTAEVMATRHGVLQTHYPSLVQADRLHDEGITGHGVTIAVLDTGHFSQKALNRNSSNQPRLLAHYDALHDQELPIVDSDDSGHGSHVTGIMVSSARSFPDGKYNGLAPDADLVIVKAFNEAGQGTYADVIRGLDWIVGHKDTYGIRILNLSFGAVPRSFYWDDPLAQAVMRAWQAGIVVVASAGNGGPGPMTVTVPGNVPYVVTVGGMTDNYTPSDPTDDFLTSFSATGPTVEGFLKPEIIAPGGHMLSLMHKDAKIVNDHPDFQGFRNYFTMSGTSQAAAVVSGVTALLLDAHPELTPDEVKCRLLASAHAAVDSDDLLAYSPFQQGAGLVDAHDAVYSTDSGCANRGLDIDKDVDGIEHYGGPVRVDKYGQFYIAGVGYSWDGSATPDIGYLWVSGNPWVDFDTWVQGNPWVDGAPAVNGNPWVDINGNPWVDINGNPWVDVNWLEDPTIWSVDLNEAMGINVWVAQE